MTQETTPKQESRNRQKDISGIINKISELEDNVNRDIDFLAKVINVQSAEIAQLEFQLKKLIASHTP